LGIGPVKSRRGFITLDVTGVLRDQYLNSMTPPANPDFAESVTASFDKQNAMHLIRATLPIVEHGRTESMSRIGTASSSTTASFMEVWPADGEKLIARGQVVRPGRSLIVTKADVFAVNDGAETLCAIMQQTIMVMHGKKEK
jgi:hypothetical protein